jgi:DNA-nicking Smr family endonuclease
MRRHRGLSPEDEALWQTVARSARPLRPVERAALAAVRQAGTPQSDPPPTPDPVPLPPAFRVGVASRRPGITLDLAPTLREAMAAAPVRMDARLYARLLRGRFAPEARIDLHGLTLAEARPALTGFVLRAHAGGLRLVLVITGKGRARDDDGPIPARTGALRHAVPQWLAAPPLAPLVLQVTPAHARHGGEGAVYVYLRRNRQSQ